MSNQEADEATILWVERLHALVDEASAPVAKAHAARLKCASGCADCCIDDLTVFEIEASVIRRHHADLLANGLPHPAGGCAFLGEDRSCRIYAHRPYVCRTQGLPLRWLEEDAAEEEIFESRDICPLNLEGPPLEDLPADELWTLGPFEQRLADRQAASSTSGSTPNPVREPALSRIALRDLFAKSEGAEKDGALGGPRRLPIVR